MAGPKITPSPKAAPITAIPAVRSALPVTSAT